MRARPFLCTPYLGFCSQKCDKSVFFPAVRVSGSPAALVDGPRRALYLRVERQVPAFHRKKDRLIANLDRFPQTGEALISRGASPPRAGPRPAARAGPHPVLCFRALAGASPAPERRPREGCGMGVCAMLTGRARGENTRPRRPGGPSAPRRCSCPHRPSRLF